MVVYFEKLPYLAIGPLRLGDKVAADVGLCLREHRVALDKHNVCRPELTATAAAGGTFDEFTTAWMACKTSGSPGDDALLAKPSQSPYKAAWEDCRDSLLPA
jgi:hypothetical protein